MTFFSVIIPAWNEGKYIKQVLAALEKNRIAGTEFEIILLDNLSDDDTVFLAREAGALILENNTEQRMTIAALRNRGAMAARGEILAFLDADMIVTPDWLSAASVRFEQGFKGALGFIESVPDDAGWVAQVWGRRAQLTCRHEKRTDFLPGRNLMVNRDVFNTVQGFDEHLTTNEDKDFTFRVVKAGYTVVRLPVPNPLHLGHEKNLCEFIRKEFWRQSSTLEFARRHKFERRTLRNPLMSLGHLVAPASGIYYILAANAVIASFFLLAWFCPSIIITLRAGRVEQDRLYPLKLLFLNFLRWNLAGSALIAQLVKGKLSAKIES
jgi:glycosyltransferase involved in cell wall biosynthesis